MKNETENCFLELLKSFYSEGRTITIVAGNAFTGKISGINSDYLTFVMSVTDKNTGNKYFYTQYILISAIINIEVPHETHNLEELLHEHQENC